MVGLGSMSPGYFLRGELLCNVLFGVHPRHGRIPGQGDFVAVLAVEADDIPRDIQQKVGLGRVYFGATCYNVLVGNSAQFVVGSGIVPNQGFPVKGVEVGRYSRKTDLDPSDFGEEDV